MSLFSHKAYNKLITMTGKKGAIFSTDRAQYQGKSGFFLNVREHERALNDNINYAQKGCAMQL